MTNTPTLPLLIVLALPGLASALEVIADDEMAGQVAQSGITLSTSVNWTTQSVIVTDVNGITSPVAGYANAGKFFFTSLGLRGCIESSAGLACTPTTNPTFNILIDAAGGTSPSLPNTASLQLAIGWDSGIGKLRILLDKIGIQNAQDANAVTIFDINQDYVDVFRPAGSPTMEVQLGGQPDGAMVNLISFNVGTVDFGQVLIRDKSDNLANNRNVRFGMAITGLDLSGTTMKVTPAGLVVSNPSLSGIGVTLSDIIAGNTTTTMGSVGVNNMSVTNLAVTISGKS